MENPYDVRSFFVQERVYNGRLDPCGAVHITIGDGGNREGLAHRYHLNVTVDMPLNLGISASLEIWLIASWHVQVS